MQTNKVLVDRAFLNLLVDIFMDEAASVSGGKEDSKKKLLAELESSGVPSAETIESLFSYAAHHNNRKVAERIAKALLPSKQVPDKADATLRLYEHLHDSHRMMDGINSRIAKIRARHRG